MAIQLKEEYKNCKIQVRTQFNQLVTVDTSKEDVMNFSKLEPFKFMFEEAETKKKKKKEPLLEAVDNDGEFFQDTQSEEAPKLLEELSLKELRAKFPDIEARSKREFLKQLSGEE